MLVGVKFCGGCNPRFDRGKAYEAIKKQLAETTDFVIAEEDGEYDALLVIGGCTNCCASHSQYKTIGDTIKLWDESHIDNAVTKIKKQEE